MGTWGGVEASQKYMHWGLVLTSFLVVLTQASSPLPFPLESALAGKRWYPQ